MWGLLRGRPASPTCVLQQDLTQHSLCARPCAGETAVSSQQVTENNQKNTEQRLRRKGKVGRDETKKGGAPPVCGMVPEAGSGVQGAPLGHAHSCRRGDTQARSVQRRRGAGATAAPEAKRASVGRGGSWRALKSC